jgi:hypothetical protein
VPKNALKITIPAWNFRVDVHGKNAGRREFWRVSPFQMKDQFRLIHGHRPINPSLGDYRAEDQKLPIARSKSEIYSAFT